jgi:hypothetical protein
MNGAQSNLNGIQDYRATTPRHPSYDRNLDALLATAPPPYGPSAEATEITPLLLFDSHYDEGAQDWRDSRPQLRHIPPPPGSENDSSEEDSESVEIVRAYGRQIGSTESEDNESRWKDIDLNDWSTCISVWLLTALVIAVVSFAAAIVWILVTQ